MAKEKKAKKTDVGATERQTQKILDKETRKNRGTPTQVFAEVMTTLLDAAVPTETSAEKSEGKKFQFTKRSHYRVTNSYYTKMLWEMFKGQHDVDLPAVEYAILAFDKERNKERKVDNELEADVDGLIGALVRCDFRVSTDCLRLDHEFLPRRWISQKDRLTGNYTGSIEQTLMAGCERCKEEYIDDVITRNKKLPPNSPDRDVIPYFTSKAEVEAYLDRQHSRGELKQNLRSQMDDIRSRIRASRQESQPRR